MLKNKDAVRRILWKEMDEDDYFSHRLVGSIGLMKIIIGKLAIGFQQQQGQDIKNINNSKEEDAVPNINIDYAPMDQDQLQFVQECIKYYREGIRGKNKKILSNNDEVYDSNFRVTEITELIEDRKQRKVRLDDKFRKILKEKRTVTGG